MEHIQHVVFHGQMLLAGFQHRPCCQKLGIVDFSSMEQHESGDTQEGVVLVLSLFVDHV